MNLADESNRKLIRISSGHIGMKAPPFTKGYLGSLTRRQDIIHYGFGQNRIQTDERLDEALLRLNNTDYQPDLAEIRRAQSELIFIPKTFEDKVFLRHLNYRLRKEYRIRQVNRTDIAMQVRNLLRAGTQLHILRTDIRRFFFRACSEL